MMTLEEIKALQDAINMRTKKMKLHQDSIDKLRKLNRRDMEILEQYWDDKYSRFKKR